MRSIKRSVQFLIAGMIICASVVHAQSNQKINADTAKQRIRNFFAGFEKQDWNLLANQLSKDFTFTSPNNDDHISIKRYKEKCWDAGHQYFKHIIFTSIVVDGNTAYAMYNITDTNNKIAHNVEYYTFSNGKIKSIEVFFGTGVHYPGNSKM